MHMRNIRICTFISLFPAWMGFWNPTILFNSTLLYKTIYKLQAFTKNSSLRYIDEIGLGFLFLLFAGLPKNLE
jgi:hypothetical protein